MIKINLLTASKSSTSNDATRVDEAAVFLDPSRFKSEAIKRGFIVLLFPMGLYAYEYYQIPLLQQQVVTLQQSITEKENYNRDKEKAVDQIKIFQESEKQFQNRISTLDRLSKLRQREIDILNMVKASLSDSSLANTWLQKLVLDEAKMSIVGFSNDDSEVTAFIDKLQKSIFFSRVVFEGAVEKVYSGKTIKEFSINCELEKEK
ncbi:MAG TPA: PilN domain-containing protein [Pseudobdellovibrionaceae bacterium]|nr:PilN domain-containing protein [Pseudobdellovibrionaceae bacterium]